MSQTAKTSREIEEQRPELDETLAPVGRIVAATFSVALVVISAMWALAVPRRLGLAFYTEQFVCVILGLALAVAFLRLPADRTTVRRHVPWFDWIAAAVGLGIGAYMAIYYPDLVNFLLMRPASIVIPGALLIVLLLEATRRATGYALVTIVIVFLLYGVLGNYVPGQLSGRAQDWDRLTSYLTFDLNGILGVPLTVSATIVVAFVFFGNLLSATGGARFFTDLALIGMGRFRGGSMKIAVVASALFGSISGSAVANVVATGVVTIPMIKKAGYPAHRAAAIEAVASTGGQLLPPVMGAAAFLMAEFLEISYAEVALAALVPAVLYYVALFIQADLEAGRLGISAVDRALVPKLREVSTGWHFPISFAALIIALFSFNWVPERAAYFGAAAVIVTSVAFGYQGKRPKLHNLTSALVQTGYGVVDIILIAAAAGIVIGVLAITGLSFNLTYSLVAIGGGNLILLLVLSAVVCIILGMGLPTLGVYVLLATLVAPALVEVGVDRIAAHLYVMYFGMMSMITPPVAVAAFAAAAIARADPMRTGYAAMSFGWTAYVIPILFVFSPSLLLMGGTGELILALVTALLGVWLVSIGMAGYFVSPLRWPMRLIFGAAGLAALIPANAFPGAGYTDIVGVVLGVGLIAREYILQKGRRTAAVGPVLAAPQD
jgi:TRAP transporter 4TM/12TM fusion protein